MSTWSERARKWKEQQAANVNNGSVSGGTRGTAPAPADDTPSTWSERARKYKGITAWRDEENRPNRGQKPMDTSSQQRDNDYLQRDDGYQNANSLDELRASLNEMTGRLETAKKAKDIANNMVVAASRSGTKDKLEQSRVDLDEKTAAYDDIQSQIRALQREIQQAENMQKGQKYSAYLNEDDFAQYSKQGAATQKLTREEAGKIFGLDPSGEKPGGMADDMISSPASPQLSPQLSQRSPYHYMTDDEVSVYNYLLAKEGVGAAQGFLDYLEETLNYRSGMEQGKHIRDIENDVGRTAMTALYGVGSGLDQFNSGVQQLFSSERLPTTAMQFGSAYIRDDLSETGPEILGSSLGQIAYDAVTTTANMAPSILVTALTGGLGAPAAVAAGAGAATLGASASGNAYNMALDEGYTKDEARNYAILVGASEAGLQYLLGGIGSLGGKITGKTAQMAVRNIDNALLRISADLGIKMVGEGMEEYLQEILEPAFRNLVFDENNEIKLVSKEAAYSFLLGVLTAGLLEGGHVIASDIDLGKTGAAVKNSGQYEPLLGNALALDPSSEAYKMASKMQGGSMHASDINIGQLLVAYTEAGGSLNFMKTPAAGTEQQTTTATSDNLLAEAIAQVEQGGTASNRTAERILADQNAVSALGITVDGMTRSQKRTAVKNAVASLANRQRAQNTQRVSTDTQAQESAAQAASAPPAANTGAEGVANFARTLDKSGAAILNGMYDGTQAADVYVADMMLAYNAGRNGAELARVNVQNITAPQAQAAYLAGQTDVSRETGINKQNGGVNVEETGANNVGGQERTPGVAASGQSGSLEAGAGSLEAGRPGGDQAQRAAGRRARAEAAGVVSQSTQEQGVAIGTDNKTLKVLPSELWDDDVRAVVREKGAQGIHVVPIVGQIEAKDAGGVFRANGWVARDGKRMLVRVDHDTLTMKQLADHEEYHVKAGRDTKLDKRLKGQLAKKYGKGWEKFLANAYAEMYFTGQEMTQELQDYILQEILADAYAGIDVLHNVEDVPMRATDLTAQVRETADKVKARGPPVDRDMNVPGNGRFSRGGKERTQNEITAQYTSDVDAILNGTKNPSGSLLVGYTPDIYQELGMPSLPFVIGAGHVYTIAKTQAEAQADAKAWGKRPPRGNYHGLGDTAVKNILETASDPVMIIRASDGDGTKVPMRSTHSVVAIVDIGTDGKNLLVPIEITADRKVNSTRMDVNVLSSAYEKTVTNLVTEAIAQENIGEVGVYYIKKEATALIGDGLQLPDILQAAVASNGIVHQLGEKVNMNLQEQTQSIQFARWFGDWQNNPQGASKAVDRNGEPLHLYHYTDGDFDSFDTSLSGSNQGQTHGDGIYLSSSPTEYSYAGKNRLDLYANARRPFEMQLTKRQANTVYEKYFSNNHNDQYGTYKSHVVEKLMSPLRVFDYLKQAASENGIKTSDILRSLHFDSVHDGSVWVVFDPTQVKSANENVGTFDRNNPKFRFSRDSEGRELTQEQVDRLTSYNALVSRPDMTVTEIDDTARYTANSQTRKTLVQQAIKNAAAIGKTDSNGGVSVHVNDIGRDVLLSTHSLRHGLDRRFSVLAPITEKAGEILQNSILINQITPQSDTASSSYVLLGAAKNAAGEPYIVRFVVNQHTNEVASVDVLYAINAKKEPAALLPAITGNPATLTDSTISIARLLDFARDYFPDVLPESVLRHYGIAERPGGKLGESALFSREADLTNPELQERLTKLLEEYGAIKPGEKPFRDVNIPQRTAKGNRVSQTVRTILEAEATPDEVVPTVEQMVADGEFSYTPYSDKQAVADARAGIEKKGWEKAVRDWFDAANRGGISKENTTVGWLLYDNAANSGDTALAIDILNQIIESQRNAAQALQAARILKQLSPETQLYGVQRSVNSLQEQINKRYGKNAPDLKIDTELAEKFLKARSDHARAEALKDIYRDIGRQMPSRLIDKFNAWRYVAMLANPRTHIRNIVGNAFFAPVISTKNFFATAIENIVIREKGGRTKAFGLRTEMGRELIRAAAEDYANIEQAMPDGKYSDLKNANRYIEEGRQIFGRTQDAKTKVGRAISGTLGKGAELARIWNSKALSAEDQFFSRARYASSLAQYCLANGITVEELKTGKGEKVAAARAYAMKEAQKSTFQDANAFSEYVSRLGRSGSENKVAKAVGTLGEGALPFRKTPANILVRSVEYSPVGLLYGIKKAVWDVQQGKATAAEAIDSIAAGMTGTALMGFGAFLAAMGLVRGHGDDEKEKEKKFKELQGIQYYALELPNGTSVTLDWMAPEAMPFFIGVNLYESTNGIDGAPKMADLLGAFTNVTEPLLEMSCLQGVNDLLESVGYAQSSGLAGIPQIAVSTGTSLLTQLVPTLFGQIERSSEAVRMTTYTDKNKWLDTDTQYLFGKTLAKIPGLDYSQIPYIDAWGRTETNGGPFERIFNNMLNPAYMSEIDTSDVETELQRLYEATGKTEVLPSRASKDFTVDKQRVDLTADQYVEFATYKGQRSFELVEYVTESAQYKRLDDKMKASVIEACYSVAQDEAKALVSAYKLDGLAEKVAEAEKSGVSAADYILFYKTQNAMHNIKDSNGNVVKEKDEQVREWLNNSGLAQGQQEYLWGTEYKSSLNGSSEGNAFGSKSAFDGENAFGGKSIFD